jgi:hypothetical protein
MKAMLHLPYHSFYNRQRWHSATNYQTVVAADANMAA